MTAVQVPVTFPEKTYSVLLGKLLRKPDAPGLQQAEGWWGLLSVPGRVPWERKRFEREKSSGQNESVSSVQSLSRVPVFATP